MTFRTPDEAVAKANNTPYGLSAGVWTEKGSRAMGMAAGAAGRRGLGQHVQPVRPGGGVRRLPGVRLRPRGRAGRAGRLPGRRRRAGASERGIEPWPDRRRQDLQALRRRRVPPLGVRPDLPGRRRRTARFLANAAPGLAQGRPGRGGRRPQGLRRLVEGDAVQPRPGDLPDRGDARGPAARVRRAAAQQPGASAAAAAEVDAGRRPAGALRRLDRQARRGVRRRQPGLRPVLLLLRARADRGGRRSSPRPARRCSGWSPCSRR